MVTQRSNRIVGLRTGDEQPPAIAGWPRGGGEMAALIRAHDWAATPLGPTSGWPAVLRGAVELMLASTCTIAVAWGPDFRLLYNDRFAANLGDRPGKALGESAEVVFGEAARIFREARRAVWRGKTVELIDQPATVDRGRGIEDVWLDVTYSPLRDDEQVVCGYFALSIDTTARVLAQRALRNSEALLRESGRREGFLLKLSDALRPIADPIAIQAAAAQLLGEHLGADRVHYGEIIDDFLVIGQAYGTCLPPLTGRFALSDLGEPLIARFRASQTVVCDDLQSDLTISDAERSAIAAAGFRAFVGVPLVKEGAWCALLAAHSILPRKWTEGEIALVEDVAERTWAAVERARAEAALRNAEERYLALFNAIDQGFCTIEVAFDENDKPVDCRFLEVSPSFERQTGIENATGRWIRELEDQSPQRFDIYGRVARTGESVRFHDYTAPDDRWWDVYAFRIKGEARVAVLFREITEQKRAEQRLRESEERKACLLMLSDALRPLSDPGAIQLKAAEMIGRQMGANRVAYVEDVGDGESFAVTRHYVDGVPEVSGRYRYADYGDGAVLEVQAGQTLVVPDVANDARLSSQGKDALIKDGAGAVLNVPLVKGGRLVAMLTTNYATAHDFMPHEIALVTEVAERTWAAVEQARAEAAMRASEDRLRRFGEASRDILWMRDAHTLQWNYLTPAFDTIYGLSREVALAGDNYRSWLELVAPEDRVHAAESIGQVRSGEHLSFEYRIARPADGAIRWLRDTGFPIFDSTGRVALICGIGEDITDAKRRQERLMGSEERLRSATEIARLGLWDWNVRTGEIHWSDEHFRMEGYAIDEVKPSYEAAFARVHPEDRSVVEAMLRRAQATYAEFDHEFRTLHPDGTIRWLHGRGRFFYDEAGEAIRMVGAMIDTTERREWEERQAVLVAELQHRTRNLIAFIGSMADKTIRQSSGIADFQSKFRNRLDALARVQGLLSRLEEHDRVTFDELIRTELTALGALDGAPGRVTLDGPSGVRLRSSTVQTLAMALHELATNAAKYGALQQPEGQLAIFWQVDSGSAGELPWLHIDWREYGVAMPQDGSEAAMGEGRELIERALPYQLNAETNFEMLADGIHCTIRIPVSASTNAGGHRFAWHSSEAAREVSGRDAETSASE